MVKTEAVQSVAACIAAAYERQTKIKPTLFVTRPAAGASILRS